MTEHDDLVNLLGPPQVAGVNAGRDALLEKSTSILRRRAVIRQIAPLGVVALLASAIGAGAAWHLKPDVIVPEYVEVRVPVEAPPSLPAPAAVTASTPADLEIKAELADDRGESARLYREAGDKYLADFRNYEQAARCYRLHLNAAGDSGRKVSTSDSWLLMSMKTPGPQGD